jgi:hypothetical protein
VPFENFFEHILPVKIEPALIHFLIVFFRQVIVVLEAVAPVTQKLFSNLFGPFKRLVFLFILVNLFLQCHQHCHVIEVFNHRLLILVLSKYLYFSLLLYLMQKIYHLRIPICDSLTISRLNEVRVSSYRLFVHFLVYTSDKHVKNV